MSTDDTGHCDGDYCMVGRCSCPCDPCRRSKHLELLDAPAVRTITAERDVLQLRLTAALQILQGECGLGGQYIERRMEELIMETKS